MTNFVDKKKLKKDLDYYNTLIYCYKMVEQFEKGIAIIFIN